MRNLISGLRGAYVGQFDYALTARPETDIEWTILSRLRGWMDHWILVQFPVIAGFSCAHAICTLATREIENIIILHIVVATALAGFLVFWIKAMVGELLRLAGRAQTVQRYPQLKPRFFNELGEQLEKLVGDLRKTEYLALMVMEACVAGGTIAPMFALGEFLRFDLGKGNLLGIEIERVAGVGTWFFWRMLLTSVLAPRLIDRFKDEPVNSAGYASSDSSGWPQSKVKTIHVSERVSLPA